MMFKCSVCEEKDRRVEDLKEQISYLRNLLNPPVQAMPSLPEIQNIQQDMILDGGGTEEVNLPDTILETPEVLAERSAMLSGTY